MIFAFELLAVNSKGKIKLFGQNFKAASRSHPDLFFFCILSCSLFWETDEAGCDSDEEQVQEPKVGGGGEGNPMEMTLV